MRPESDCKRCDLCGGRKNIVLPTGDLNSKVAFVGEGPGENEDFFGMPFVGRAGKILDDIMNEAGLERSRVMITNTVKCRPPNNREPTDEEMKACRPFLDSELEHCEMVVGLGKSACRDLIGFEGSMKNVLNKRQIMFVNGKEILFIPTYHPMACVYKKDARVGLLETMKLVKEFLDQ
jgi:uracil-DNA glycosylase family 4